MRFKFVFVSSIYVVGLGSCETDDAHEVESLSTQRQFFYAFAYASAPPEGASLVIASRPSCQERSDNNEMHFSFLLNSTAVGQYVHVQSISGDDFFADPERLVADIRIPMVSDGSRVINYALREGNVSTLNFVGDGHRSPPSTLHGRVVAILNDGDYAATSCDGNWDVGAETFSSTCNCIRADGELATCTTTGEFDELKTMEDCCGQLNHGVEEQPSQPVVFNFTAKYCSMLCQDLGNGMAEKMCVPSL